MCGRPGANNGMLTRPYSLVLTIRMEHRSDAGSIHFGRVAAEVALLLTLCASGHTPQSPARLQIIGEAINPRYQWFKLITSSRYIKYLEARTKLVELHLKKVRP
jgi:hypothetical protein